MIPETKFLLEFEKRDRNNKPVGKLERFQIVPGSFSQDVLQTIIRGQIFDPQLREIVLTKSGRQPIAISSDNIKRARRLSPEKQETFIDNVIQAVRDADRVTIKRVGTISS